MNSEDDKQNYDGDNDHGDDMNGEMEYEDPPTPLAVLSRTKLCVALKAGSAARLSQSL